VRRIGYVYEKIYGLDNIKNAILQASKGKRNQRRVKNILDNIDIYSIKIQQMLKEKTYIPSEYVIKEILDNSSNKKRIIYKPKFYPDQIIHWCLILQIQSILLRGMYFYNCGSIPNRGISFAKNAVSGWLKKDKVGTKYCLKMDISKFYPSINNILLKNSLRRVIKDESCLWLIDQIVDSCVGLPIGNYTSQWFSNYFLQDLDNYIKHDLKIKYYVRYIDDMVLLDSNKKKLRAARIKIEQFLKTKNLKLKSNWQVFQIDKRPIDFLGFRFYRNKIFLRKKLCLRIKRRIKKVYKKKRLNYIDSCAIVSYCGWMKQADCYNFYIKNVKPFISIKLCKRMVSNHDKKNNIRRNTKI
jgi:hypothetical protein